MNSAMCHLHNGANVFLSVFRANSTQHQTGVQAAAEATTPGQCFPAGRRLLSSGTAQHSQWICPTR